MGRLIFAKIGLASLYQISSSSDMQIVNVYTSLSKFKQIYITKNRIIRENFSSP